MPSDARERSRSRRWPELVLVVATFASTAAAKEPAPSGKAAKPAPAVPADARPLDLGDAAKDKLIVLSDRKGHFVAMVPRWWGNDDLYYGDGTSFWQQRRAEAAGDDDSYWIQSWDPRYGRARLIVDHGKYAQGCGARKTELLPLPSDEQKALLAAATFHGPRWKTEPYSLSRDDKGRYFYVDRPQDPDQSKRFRLFIGMKGDLKLQAMVNVVSDSGGDIFSTKSGSLRLVLDKKEFSWNQGAKKTVLTPLPLAENSELIYTELGVYVGERLGTPCDDL